jgi:uncharacterized protein involved in copper resistance
MMRGVLLVCLWAAAAQAKPLHGKAEFSLASADEGTLDSWKVELASGPWNLKSEGERQHGTLEKTEWWAYHAYPLTEKTLLHTGFRVDSQPEQQLFLLAGVEAALPGQIQTEAHAFFSKEGYQHADIEIKRPIAFDSVFTLIPELKTTLLAQDRPDERAGAGFSRAKASLKLRYALAPHISPFIEGEYSRRLGETAAIAHSRGRPVGDATVHWGVQLKF